MALDRLTRQNVGFWLIYPEQIPDYSDVTIGQLNNPAYVKNITCSVLEDSTTFILGDSSTNQELTYCSKGNETTIGSKNPSISFTALRDGDKAATGVFNLFRDLNLWPDVPYYALMRIGKPYDATFTTSDRLFLVGVTTNTPLDVLADQASVKLTQTYVPNGQVNWNFNPAAV